MLAGDGVKAVLAVGPISRLAHAGQHASRTAFHIALAREATPKRGKAPKKP
eukprot:CAMPEP_0118877870 /NCGR_PEP_ID=MMETSP1163-20130328/18004_1 /TAXON_ID=124430 /ORGANISM="Phaeomonas parva, Strain CCMP2877" /LENGTH=50 /DNA_ID=CAMNT_0006813633 /DNA_START=604 /DNA_END=752 /DNA_ORIENTATION=+